jgi:hypothetical protein
MSVLRRIVAFVAAVAVLTAVLATAPARADNQLADDELTAGISNLIRISALPGQTIAVTARLMIDRTGGVHVTPGSTLTFVHDPANSDPPLPGPATVQGATVQIPSVWNGQSPHAVATAPSTITFTAHTTPGIVIYRVRWKSTPDAPAIVTEQPLRIRLTVTKPTPGGDTTPPVVSVPGDLDVEAAGPSGAAVDFDTSATDNIDGAVPTDCSHESGATFPIGTTTVECSASDVAGNTGTSSFDITVADTTGPTMSPSDPVAAEATGPGGAVASFDAPVAIDLVDGSRAVTCSPASGSTFAVGTTVVTCTASDVIGNETSVQHTVAVADTTAPILAVPADVTHEATSAAGASMTFDATAHDVVDGTLPVDCVPPSGSTFALGTTTVACTATDSASNESTDDFDITVVDSTAPALTLPSLVTAEATGPTGAAVAYAATASDLVDGSVDPSCLPASGSTFALGTTTVTCTAIDVAGSSTSGSFEVDVVDTTNPVLDVPDPITGVEATGPDGAIVTYAVGATDIADDSPSVSCAPLSGATFEVGTTTVDCTATDADGNTSTESFTVTVDDTTAPVLSPDEVVVEATGPTGAIATFDAVGIDVVNGDIAAVCDVESGALLPIGTTTVTCSAVDASGNEMVESFDIVVRDTTPPTLTLPTEKLALATSPSGAVVTFGATAWDAVSGVVPVTCTPGSGATFAVGETTASCSATDGAGNAATGSFLVRVLQSQVSRVDYLAGSGGGFSSNWIYYTNAGCWGGKCAYNTSSSNPSSTYTFTLTEPARVTIFGRKVGTACGCHSWAVDGGPSNAFGETGTGASSPYYTTHLLSVGTHSLTTTAGKTSQYAIPTALYLDYLELVTDPVSALTAPPLLTVPTNILIHTPNHETIARTYSTSAFDIYNVPITPVCSHPSGSQFPGGTTTVSCTATDVRGNATTKTFTVTVILHTTRLEYLVSANGFSSDWIYYTNAGACSGNSCAYNTSSSNPTSTYTFTLTEPARVTVYGRNLGTACGCHTWSVDGGPSTSFGEVGTGGAAAYYTTQLLAPGTHHLTTTAGKTSQYAIPTKLYLDYLDIVTEV